MNFINEHEWLGYRSLSAFAAAGTRSLLQECRREVYERMLVEECRVSDENRRPETAMMGR